MVELEHLWRENARFATLRSLRPNASQKWMEQQPTPTGKEISKLHFQIRELETETKLDMLG